MKWIILNDKKDINQPKIYINYKDCKDVYPYEPEIAEKYAHYDALISNDTNINDAKIIFEKIINDNICSRQIQGNNKTEIKIMLWNINSLRDFTKKNYLIQQLYENQIDIAILNETMLTHNHKLYIKNFRIYRADANFRKGVAILISNLLDCDAYKIIEDNEGRYLQIKLKNNYNEINISTAYVEPELDKRNDIIPENILNAEIFAGDLNKMNSGLEIKSNVYHIKNIGEFLEEIKTIKKISDHPILIFKKVIPFKRIENIKTITRFNESILKINYEEIKKQLMITIHQT